MTTKTPKKDHRQHGHNPKIASEVVVAVALSAFRGANVREAADLEAAMEVATSTRIDAVLLDLGLPGCRRIEALQRFKREIPVLPVVIISSNEDSQVISDALAAGASAYFPKTISAAGIAAALRGDHACRSR